MDFIKLLIEFVIPVFSTDKLSLLGLNTSSIDWLNNYLSDRVLHVRVGSALS